MRLGLPLSATGRLESKAREEGMTGEARAEFRREHAVEWLQEIRAECQRLSRTTLPQSALGKAVTYKR